MPLKGEAKKRYMREYMRRRCEEHRAFSEAAALAAERRRMKRAVKRWETAKRWAKEHPIDERLLSLSFHWDCLVDEDRMKRREKDARAVEKAFKKPRAVTGV